MAVSTAVFKPLKLNIKSPDRNIGRGKENLPLWPDSASFASAGPPG